MKTYRETMDELRFTEQEKEAMVDRLLERGGPRRKGLNLRCAAVAVAAAAVLTVGAGAAVVLTPAGEVFASVLGGAPAQTEILDWMGVPVGASDTHNGGDHHRRRHHWGRVQLCGCLLHRPGGRTAAG